MQKTSSFVWPNTRQHSEQLKSQHPQSEQRTLPSGVESDTGGQGPGPLPSLQKQQRHCSLASCQLTLKNFHREDSPGIFQVGNVNIASCITGQANVQNPGKEKNKRELRVKCETVVSISYFAFQTIYDLHRYVPNLGTGELMESLNHQCLTLNVPKCSMSKPVSPFLKLH